MPLTFIKLESQKFLEDVMAEERRTARAAKAKEHWNNILSMIWFAAIGSATCVLYMQRHEWLPVVNQFLASIR